MLPGATSSPVTWWTTQAMRRHTWSGVKSAIAYWTNRKSLQTQRCYQGTQEAPQKMKKFLKVPKKEAPELKVVREFEVVAKRWSSQKQVQYTQSLSENVMTCSVSCLRMTPKFNGTASLGTSTKLTTGPRWTEQRTGDCIITQLKWYAED